MALVVKAAYNCCCGVKNGSMEGVVMNMQAKMSTGTGTIKGLTWRCRILVKTTAG